MGRRRTTGTGNLTRHNAVLAALGPKSTWRRAASDPNCPAEALVCLLMHHPREVLENPVWPLVQLETGLDHELWRRLSFDASALLELVQHPRCPPPVLDYLRTHRADLKVLTALAGNPALPQSLRELVLLDLAVELPPHFVIGLLGRLPSERTRLVLHAGFSEQGPGPSPEPLGPAEMDLLWNSGALGRLLALHQPNCPEVLLREAVLAKGSWATVVARHPALPQDLTEAILAGKHPGLLQELARNPALTAQQMDQLARRPNAQARRALAGRADLPEGVALLLAERGLRDCRLALSRNAHVSWAVRQALEGDYAKEVREALAAIATGQARREPA